MKHTYYLVILSTGSMLGNPSPRRYFPKSAFGSGKIIGISGVRFFQGAKMKYALCGAKDVDVVGFKASKPTTPPVFPPVWKDLADQTPTFGSEKSVLRVP